MRVKLISHSTAPEDSELDNVQELIAYCAKVSNPTNQINKKTSEKLITYLIKHQHWSPLEMVSACLEIETTRDIAHQMVRHRSFSFQEFSQRYADPTKDLEFEIRDARLQDPKNRQNSLDLDYGDDEHHRINEEFSMNQHTLLMKATQTYEAALKAGVAKEQARAVLPEGMSATTLYMAGTLRSWIHYCQLRMANGTQKEHADIAKECWKIIGTHFPSVIKAFE